MSSAVFASAATCQPKNRLENHSWPQNKQTNLPIRQIDGFQSGPDHLNCLLIAAEGPQCRNEWFGMKQCQSLLEPGVANVCTWTDGWGWNGLREEGVKKNHNYSKKQNKLDINWSAQFEHILYLAIPFDALVSALWCRFDTCKSIKNCLCMNVFIQIKLQLQYWA
jgi:hypothetical protein